MSDDIRAIQDRIVDPDPYVEEVLRNLDAKVNRTIYGPDGVTPLLEPMVDDRTITYAKDGESFSLGPTEWMYRLGRMARDGMSLEAIRAELDLPKGLVSDKTINMAMTNAVALLESAIRDGVEPEESVRVLGYREVAPETPTFAMEPDSDNEATTEDALELGRKVVEGWKRG